MTLPPRAKEAAEKLPRSSSTDKWRHHLHDRPAFIGHKDKTFKSGAEVSEFQAEVSRLMDIIINSLYSNKDIFLRELISNGSDSLDKIRFLSLTDESVLGAGDDANLDIRIKVDKENGVLSIRDRGVGMTKAELKENLGTIAKSGTSAFLEQMQKGGDMNLIGQFGVGFYSVYLVADFVEVRSKHNSEDRQWIWQSKADGAFAISEDEGEPLGRGVEINIYLKEEAQEYLEEDKLKELVEKYSEFINFPIYLWNSEEVEEEVPLSDEELAEQASKAEEEEEEDVEETDEDDESADDEDDEVEDEDEEELPTTKKVKKTVWDWKNVNDNKAIWLRSSTEVEDDEYSKFYKALSKDDKEPLSYTHFKAEGDVEFKSILFIPEKPPQDLFDNYYNKAAALKLYVRRVFISDEFDELLPKYLSFIKGIVDSDTLPLNVSRETLQQHTSLKTIKKKLVRKALDMIRKLAEEGQDDDDDEAADAADEETKYDKFWKNYGKAIKLGIIEDASNRTRLAKLMRFYTSKSPTKLVSLEQYVERMKPGQKSIYYLAGESREALEKSPFLEKLLQKDLEVIYFTDPIDEYTMQNLTEFDDFKFSNASKDDLKFGDDTEAAKARLKKVKEEFKDFTKWWKEILPSEEVEAVKISNRLVTTPCSVVTSKYGWSANMERIMKAQALSDDGRMAYMRGRKTLEINPGHPIIKALKEKSEDDAGDEDTKRTALIMYETALLESGFMFEEPKGFAGRLFDMVRRDLGVEADAEVEEPDVEPEAEAEAQEAPKDEL